VKRKKVKRKKLQEFVEKGGAVRALPKGKCPEEEM